MLHSIPAGANGGEPVERKKRARIRTPAQYARLAELSQELAELRAEEARARTEMHRVVASMRAEGASWAVIGQIMGITYQGAHKRFTPRAD